MNFWISNRLFHYILANRNPPLKPIRGPNLFGFDNWGVSVIQFYNSGLKIRLKYNFWRLTMCTSMVKYHLENLDSYTQHMKFVRPTSSKRILKSFDPSSKHFPIYLQSAHVLQLPLLQNIPSLKAKGLFRSLPVWKMDTVALSFVFDKNYPIMDYLGLKDSSRQLRTNCAISYFFTYI